MNFDMSTFCNKAYDILNFAGWVLTIFKIAIPILIIAFGIFDFGKAVTAGKEDEIQKSAKTLMYRAIAGVVIFFIPTIVLWLFNMVQGYTDIEGDFSKCQDAVLYPWKD